MSLEKRSLISSVICLFIVLCSIFLYRWSVYYFDAVNSGQQLVITNQRELRNLNDSLKHFEAVQQNLDSDPRLIKQFHEKEVSFYAEFGKRDVKNIDHILQSTYHSEGLFELKRFNLKHFKSNVQSSETSMLLSIEGIKRLEMP